MLKAIEFGLLAVSLLIVFALIVIGPKARGSVARLSDPNAGVDTSGEVSS